MQRKQNRLAKKQKADEVQRNIEEAQGRLLEHAWAKGFYAGVEASGVFIPGDGGYRQETTEKN